MLWDFYYFTSGLWFLDALISGFTWFIIILAIGCVIGALIALIAIFSNSKPKPKSKSKAPKTNSFVYKVYNSMIRDYEKDPTLKITLKRETLIQQKDYIAPEQFEELLTRYDNLKK